MKIKFFDLVTQIDDLPEHNPGSEAVGKVELLDIVAITQDFPEHNLRRGEVGTVVHVFSMMTRLRSNSWCFIMNQGRWRVTLSLNNSSRIDCLTQSTPHTD